MTARAMAWYPASLGCRWSPLSYVGLSFSGLRGSATASAKSMIPSKAWLRWIQRFTVLRVVCVFASSRRILEGGERCSVDFHPGGVGACDELPVAVDDLLRWEVAVRARCR